MSTEQKQLFHIMTHIPLLFLAMFGGGVVLYRFLPLRFLEAGSTAGMPFGFFLILAGTILLFVAEKTRRHFFTQLTNTCYNFATGPYKHSRHPGMLAMLMMYFGVGIVLGSWSFLGLGVVLFFIVSYGIIPRYERIITNICNEYADYQSSVRKFLGKKNLPQG